VLVLGGTGFIGWNAAHEFLHRDWHVTAVALPPPPAPGLFPPVVRVELADFHTMSDVAFVGLLQNHDAAVFAIGADDRTTPKAPAYPFFKQANVDATARFIRLCRRARVRNVVLLGSYFCHFARIRPGLELARHHPYIRSRVKQEDAAVSEADPGINCPSSSSPTFSVRCPVACRSGNRWSATFALRRLSSAHAAAPTASACST